MLTRLGNKSKLKDILYPYFPEHTMRIDLFFGAGGAYFELPKPKYSILNDLDDDVFNLYQVVKNQKENLLFEITHVPITESLLKHWCKNNETTDLMKAVRFLVLSNFSYLGKGNTLRLGLGNEKNILLKNIEKVFTQLKNVKLTNRDFREVLPRISFNNKVLSKSSAFVYLDPVYLETEHWYKVPKWTKKDTNDCFIIMAESGIKCALSEFDHPYILDLAKKHKFEVNVLKTRQNIKNIRTEIIITNYSPNTQKSLFEQQ